jgi:hypothetical protein
MTPAIEDRYSQFFGDDYRGRFVPVSGRPETNRTSPKTVTAA